MEECAGNRGGGAHVRGPSRLLLVSDSDSWSEAVQGAASDIGGFTVARCGAREALLRLAGSRERFSHILVHPGSAEGWLTELVHMSAASGGSPTEMLALGADEALPRRIAVIRSANRRSVRRALTPSVRSAKAAPSLHAGELSSVLNGATIEARYQPIVGLADRKPVCLEALVRLNHPTRGTLLPDHFVPQAEDAGLAAHLTELVVQRALDDMQGPIGELGLLLSLNFPLDVLLMPAVLARLDAQRKQAGIAADRVAIELTESRPVEDIAGLARAVERLRGGGYRVAIDDVGPAVPRVRELLELPFTSVKLDKQIVQQADEPGTDAFIRSVTAAARDRGMVVIAEGVEDVPIWQRMQAAGAAYAQGFLVARPLPASAVSLWFGAWLSQPDFV